MVHARHPVQGSKKGSAMEIELTDYFTIGVDLEAYSSMDELVDKCAYDLAHDEERKQIAKNGYDKVSVSHAYPHRIREMLKTLIPIG
ncbi:glycosyltransferase family 1 protein [Lachnospiraceae bacterium OM04-12BH]|nr:glycosyltransferase family 1 protein [Lachnospiraceae bacterium OM04-12BH]